MPSRRPRRSPSAIDRRQKDLEREQADVQRRIIRLQAVLVDAPRRAEELRKARQEEELARRHGLRHGNHDVFCAPASDARPGRRHRPLRRERRAQWLHFLLLLLTFSVLVWFLLLKLP